MGRMKLSPGIPESVGVIPTDDVLSSVISTSEAIQEMISQSGRPVNRVPKKPTKPARPLHRLATVREEQRISLTRVARRLSIDIVEARRQERETTDLLLSQLCDWRAVLQVPMAELVVEPDSIPSNPIRSRSQLIKIMKTVRTILETSKDESTRILATQLCDQLVELMPELKTVAAWPSVGQAREHREPGQAALRRFDSVISRRLEE